MESLAVLVVDDNAADRYLLKRQINETNMVSKVFEEDNGESAIKFFKDYEDNRQSKPREYPPLIIFLDINMPIVDGFGFLAAFEKIRENYDLSSIVVMMFSSSNREEEKEKALSYEFVKDFLIKGDFSSKSLKEKIEMVSANKLH